MDNITEINLKSLTMSKEIKYYGPGLPVSVGIKEINKLIDAVNEARKDLAAAKLRTKSK